MMLLVTFILGLFYQEPQIDWSQIHISAPDPVVESYNDEISIENIIRLMNKDRATYGLEPLKENHYLDGIAFKKAADMYSYRYFSHENTEGNLTKDWIDYKRYHYGLWGENLAVLFDTASATEIAWMNSALHRENILNPRFKDVGVSFMPGIYQGVDTTYIVVEFAYLK